jgi:hypothetical protein
MWVACYGYCVVKDRVHAEGKQKNLPLLLLATFRFRCSLWVLSLIVVSWGAHTQFAF